MQQCCYTQHGKIFLDFCAIHLKGLQSQFYYMIIFCKFFSFGSGYFSIKGILQLEANMP